MMALASAFTILRTARKFYKGTHSNTSGSNSLAMTLQQQLEQSGLLQQLPAFLTATAQQLEAAIETATPAAASTNQQAGEEVCAPVFILHPPPSRDAYNVLNLLEMLTGCLVGFYSAHAAGPPCLVPAARLIMASLQYLNSTESFGPSPQERQAAAGHIPSNNQKDGASEPNWQRGFVRCAVLAA